MGVDKVEAATTEGTPELEARLGVGLLALTAVKGEHLDVYAKRMDVLDQVAHEAARRRSASVGYMLVRQSTFTRRSPAFGVSRDAERRMRVRGGLSAPAVALVAGLVGGPNPGNIPGSATRIAPRNTATAPAISIPLGRRRDTASLGADDHREHHKDPEREQQIWHSEDDPGEVVHDEHKPE